MLNRFCNQHNGFFIRGGQITIDRHEFVFAERERIAGVYRAEIVLAPQKIIAGNAEKIGKGDYKMRRRLA